MEYQEYIELQNRMEINLLNEQDYYKSLCVQLTIMLLLASGDAGDILDIIYEYFEDLISDSETESQIVSLIKLRGQVIVDNYTEVYFEGCPEYTLYSNILMRINNSSKMRAANAYPNITMFFNLIRHKFLQKKSYNVIKRKKYLTENDYGEYLEVLKK